METNIKVNNVDIDGEDSPDESTAEELVRKLIAIKDTKCEELMSQCSDRAKQIRNKINEMLETRVTNEDNASLGADGHDIGPQIDTNSLLNLQKELELEINGLNKTSKTNTSDENTNNCCLLANNKTNHKTNEDKDSQNNTTNDNQSNCSQKVAKSNQKSASDDNKLNPKPEVSTNSRKSETNIAINANNSSRKPSKNVFKNRMTSEQLNKKLSTFASDAERISYLSNSLIEVSEENRNLSQLSKQSERFTNQLSKEKDQMQTEQNRLVLAKSRLESLCRELQRQNKIIKEESLLKIKEEEEKRREIANKFQSTLNEIMSLIAENQKRNNQLKEENADLAQKLKALMGHYESWERSTEKIIKQKDLETQLMKAKFAKTEIILNQEKQTFLKEKQQLIQMIADLQKRCADMSESELRLRTELSVYTNKYEEFQSVLGKSNDMFSSFKKDMERMSKQIKKLEKETQLWKQRWETSNVQLLKVAEEKQKRDSEYMKSLQKIITLEKLCRAMQEERAILHQRLVELAPDVYGDNALNDNQTNDNQSADEHKTSELPNDSQPLNGETPADSTPDAEPKAVVNENNE